MSATVSESALALGLILPALAASGCRENKNVKAERLTEIGRAYHAFWDASKGGAAPAKVEDLPGLRPDTADEVRKGNLVVIWGLDKGVLMRSPDGDMTILGWENGAPTKGGIVLLLDTGTETLSAAELRSRSKAKPLSAEDRQRALDLQRALKARSKGK
jgi:hypothetical protein